MEDDTEWEAVTFENCHSVVGPFYHGTAAELRAGDLVMPGFAGDGVQLDGARELRSRRHGELGALRTSANRFGFGLAL